MMKKSDKGFPITFLDCTFRDGGYYTAWDFPADLIQEYLRAMSAAGVDVVELGLRSLINEGFKGACAFTPDDFLRRFEIPETLGVGVMVNASELLRRGDLNEAALAALFPETPHTSPVRLVRVACHVHELVPALPAARWLHDCGFDVGFNLMQVADRTEEEIAGLADEASRWPIDVLYFADSLGSLDPERTATIVRTLRSKWGGAIGVHAHDNMGMAQSNALRAVDEGATWVDATVTGMGRGPGNPRTEHMVIEIGERRGSPPNITPLLELIRRFFEPMRQKYGWGTNPYYYLAGKHGIHPTYVQHMLSDARFDPEDVLSVIEHLKTDGAHQYSADQLEFARHFYPSEPSGSWDPAEEFAGREVLILGAGPSASVYADGLVAFIETRRPVVIALNTQRAVDESLIDYRAACHPIRLLTDVEDHLRLKPPLITPASMLPSTVSRALERKDTRDYGLQILAEQFAPRAHHAVIPSSLVIAYALAVAARGGAGRIFLAGFDGYGAGDPRTREVEGILSVYETAVEGPPLISLTPTEYSVLTRSLYSPVLD